MKKSLIFSALILFFGVLFVGLFFSREPRKIVNTKDLLPLICDLNLQECEFKFKDKKVRANFKEKPVQSLIENELFVEFPQHNFKNLNAKIYGLNMFMGEINVPFKRVNLALNLDENSDKNFTKIDLNSSQNLSANLDENLNKNDKNLTSNSSNFNPNSSQNLTTNLKPSEIYKANIVFSACVLEMMRFRVEFFDGKTPLNFHFDIDIKR